MNTYWNNPYKQAQPIDLWKLLVALSDPDEKPWGDINEQVTHYTQNGVKLDAYIIPTHNIHLSVGIRFGSEDDAYFTPYITREQAIKHDVIPDHILD